MDTNKTFAQAIFPASVLPCLAAGFASLGWLVTVAALIPVVVCLLDVLECIEPAAEVAEVGDWSELMAELAEPKAVRVAFPVWTGWTGMASAKVAREADPVILFEVSCTGPWGGPTRKVIPQARVASELQFLTRGRYKDVKVRRLAA